MGTLFLGTSLAIASDNLILEWGICGHSSLCSLPSTVQPLSSHYSLILLFLLSIHLPHPCLTSVFLLTPFYRSSIVHIPIYLLTSSLTCFFLFFPVISIFYSLSVTSIIICLILVLPFPLSFFIHIPLVTCIVRLRPPSLSLWTCRILSLSV